MAERGRSAFVGRGGTGMEAWGRAVMLERGRGEPMEVRGRAAAEWHDGARTEEHVREASGANRSRGANRGGSDRTAGVEEE